MREKIKTDQDQVFKNFSVQKALRVMIVPAVISQLIVLIYNMADTFYVGQTNNPYMVAGTSLILPVFNITLCLAGLAGVGGGALISRLLGQNREDEARRVSAFSLYLGILIAAVFSGVMGIFMKPILELLGAGANTYEYARQYAFCVIVFGGVPTVLSNVLSNLIRSIGRSREAGAGIILGGLLNIALDPLFIFGFGLGISGTVQLYRMPVFSHCADPNGKGICDYIQSEGRNGGKGEYCSSVCGRDPVSGGYVPV